MILSNQRQLFELPSGSIYLNCASLSPLLKSVRIAGYETMARRSNPASVKNSDWFEPVEELRELLGKIINCSAENIAVIPAVSYGMAVAARNISLDAGKSILLLDKEFPSNYYIWQELAAQSGALLTIVTRSGEETWTEAVTRNINENTGLISIPNCHWTDGSILDLELISQQARKVQAKLVIDASQSLGAYPLDIARIKPDFLVSTGYKWQLGAYGLGYLYADPVYGERGVPLEFSWLNKLGAEDFASLVEYRSAFRKGARRFDMGESSSFVNVAMAIAALKQVLEWKVPDIQESIAVMTKKIEEETIAMGLQTANSSHRVGHFLGVYFPEEKIRPLQAKLADNKISVGFRGSSVRVSPHLYNDMAEIEKLLSVFKEVI